MGDNVRVRMQACQPLRAGKTGLSLGPYGCVWLRVLTFAGLVGNPSRGHALMTSPTPPPEARLIRERRENTVPRLSMREAARRAAISAPWWRMIETGIRRVQGQDFPERANDSTLAQMALVVGVTPAELIEAGRSDAARLLAKLLEAPTDGLATLAADVANARGLTERQKQELLRLLGQ
jgi:hypothetical protein